MRLTKPPKNDPHAIFLYGVECGIEQERERILALWDAEMKCPCEEAMQHLQKRIKEENQ